MLEDCMDTIGSCKIARRTKAELLIILAGQFAEWRERARGRLLLQQLDDRMLRDIGLNRSDVERECAKHFWQH